MLHKRTSLFHFNNNTTVSINLNFICIQIDSLSFEKSITVVSCASRHQSAELVRVNTAGLGDGAAHHSLRVCVGEQCNVG